MGTGEASRVDGYLGGGTETRQWLALEPLRSAGPEQTPPELEVTLRPGLAQGARC